MTYEDDLYAIAAALDRISAALSKGIAVTPSEAANLQVAAADLTQVADWMEAG